ncbi:MAG TPA: acyl-CoA dehydrogenase family protein, partial [Sphingomicrobium sp.]|nr:acyl-CoA dehydrogenase family protein [Sphingomicrobium sp.]
MMADLDSFRAETRAWLEANCPAEMRLPMKGEKDLCWGGRNFEFQSEEQKQWLDVMASRGWTVPDWPKEYSGGGLSAAESKILKEEMRELGCRPPLTSFGISMLGPALLKYGNEEQKKRFLTEIARGEIRWCQGYSEPGAGSDLAGLQTKAEDKGDHYLVNGQKVWTSYADQADWIFCLVRTSSESKHGGISFLLFDMASPGVSTKPILLISGNSPFCETFFDDVKVPKDQLVGEVDKGWDVAKYLLGHEREMISGMGLGSGIGTGASGVMLGPVAKPEDPLLRAEI